MIIKKLIPLLMIFLLCIQFVPVYAKDNLNLTNYDATRITSDEQDEILNDYKRGNKDLYLEQRKEIANQINAIDYVDEQYFITDSFYEEYNSTSMLIPLGASILINPDRNYSSGISGVSLYASDPVINYFWESALVQIPTNYGTATLTGGVWEVDGHLAFCGQANYAAPKAGYVMNPPIKVENNDNLRKVLYYGYKCPSDRITQAVGGDINKAACITNELTSYAYSNTTIAGTATGGNHMVARQYSWIFKLPSPPENFSVYAVTSKNTGINWQGISTKCQTLIYYQFEEMGTLTLQKNSSNPSIENENYSLLNAVYGIYSDANCSNLIKKITLDTNPKSIELLCGTYYLKEISSPSGYLLSDKKTKIEILNKQTTAIEVEDEPITYSFDYLFIKKDKNKDIPLSNVQFEVKFFDKLTNECLKQWILKSDEQGKVILDESHKVSGDSFYTQDGMNVLPIGYITIQELSTIDGYILNTEKIEKQINESFQPFDIFNEKNSLKIIKTDGENDMPLANVEFEHTFGNQKEILKTDDNGLIQLEGLPKGKHTLKETKTNQGYELSNEIIEFEVKEDGQIFYEQNVVTSINIKNNILPFTIRIKKVNEHNQSLKNAQFTLYDDSDCKEVVDVQYSDENGFCEFKNLKNNEDYYVVETKAPDGYENNENIIEVIIDAFPQYNYYNILVNGEYTSINENTHTITLTIANKELVFLPITGSIGQLGMIVCGVLLMILVLKKGENNEQ
ncbi:MAG: SpaA isopeptide-forming pilin-related protein [Erysipelotrichaceae bacterium]|uniref:SpaA isopeptide-forming pilin-related protein n=1 Tax=Floccifex sp. TaxID=2815810 RepID=UPI002A7603A7|nr:SpaA isopeptide-forming pilin-related protein [Floccifex sp.]MDD7281478.1 SpaA isopeptide-forming pilin-related protein [Erysipelotrichaceae bacterium]MDY2957729.1 SpaA isopeptide-forming pilin-related protein [Floccifex sp.]